VKRWRLIAMKRILLASLPAFIISVSALPSDGASWPTWRGSNRDNRSPDTGLLKSWNKEGPPLIWTFENAGKGYSSPAIVDSNIFLTGSQNGKAHLICLDAKTGKERWRTIIGEDPERGYNTGWGAGTRGAPTVGSGFVFALSANGELAAVNAADGKVKWKKDLVKDFGGNTPDWGYSESPLLDGGRLLITPGGKDGAILALDPATGEEIWRSEGLPDEAQYSSIVAAEIDGRRQYIQLFMNTLAGVDAKTGKTLWTSPWPGGRTAVIPTPIYHDEHVYITSGYGAGSKLVSIKNGEAKNVWENKVMKNHHGGVVLVDGYLYGFSDVGGLICQNFKTGEQVWSKRGEGIQKGAVHYADGMLYCQDEHEGSVFLVEANPNEYIERGRFQLPRETKLRAGTQGKIWTHPVVLDGKLYLRDQDLFFCFNVANQ
jgi:outer membrane protein assembly factor BamB